MAGVLTDSHLLAMQSMLANCLNEDNGLRAAAEASVKDHLNQHRELFIYGLVKLLKTCPTVQVRVLSAIILRQVLPASEPVLFSKLQPELQKTIQHALLSAISEEPERYVRTQISDTVAALAGVLLYDKKWPEFFPALYTLCQNPNDGVKICALSILGKLSESSDNLLDQIGTLYNLFSATMTKANALLVRVEACNACSKVINIIEQKSQTKEYQKFLPYFVETLGDCLTNHEDSETKRVLSGLVDIATEDGKFFEPYVRQIVPVMYTIGADTNNAQLDDGIRQYALEVLLSIMENCPTMVRKNPEFIGHTILVSLALMMDLEDDPAWGTKSDSKSNNAYDDSNYDCGEAGFDRIGAAVKGAKFWPIFSPIVQKHLANPDWRYRHAALQAIAHIESILELKQIPVNELAGFILDPHPRVRYAAIQVLGQLPIEFKAVVQKQWHKVLFPALMKPLEDFAHPRLQAYAADGLLNLVDDDCPPKVIKIYLHPLMRALIGLLKQSHPMVQNRVMPVMASIAGRVCKLDKTTADNVYLPYYDEVVPLMIHIIENANTKETRMLRARAMESVSYIGMFVGPQKFLPDAQKIVALFLNIMQQAAAKEQALAAQQGAKKKRAVSTFDKLDEDSDYSEHHMLSAWTRICSCLKEQFVPILPYVMPQAFAAITTKREGEWSLEGFPGLGIHKRFDENGNELDEQPDEDDEEEQTGAKVMKDGTIQSLSVSKGASLADAVSDKPMTFHYDDKAHTAALEDKSGFMSLLLSFAYDLGEHYLPYVKDTAAIFVPLLHHPSDEIRGPAVEMMAHLIHCAVAAHAKGTASPDFVKELFEVICKNMLDCLAGEPLAELLQVHVSCLQEVIDESLVLSRQVIDAKMLLIIGQAIVKLLKQSHNRIEARERKFAEEEAEGDLDEERIFEYDERDSLENGLNQKAAKLIGSLIQSHGELILPVLDQIYEIDSEEEKDEKGKPKKAKTCLFEEIRRMVTSKLDSTKQIGLFILDDIFEHIGAPASKYFPITLETITTYACALNCEHGVRQAAAYGLHVAAKHGGVNFQPYVVPIANGIVESVKADPTYLQRNPQDPVGKEWHPRSVEDEGEPVDEFADEDEEGPPELPDELEGKSGGGPHVYGDDTSQAEDIDEESRHACLDNLVSALGAIARYQNRPDLYPVWLTFLPLRADEGEGPNCYNLLLDLIDNNHPAILGENFANLPQILTIFLSLVGTNFLVNKLLRARVGRFFVTVKSMPPQLLQQVKPHLHHELQQKLEAVLDAIQ